LPQETQQFYHISRSSLVAAGLARHLSGEWSNFTVFAPPTKHFFELTCMASGITFKAERKEKLAAILYYM